MDDPYELSRFVLAQARDYGNALAELRAGQKRSHWMWYVFPQYDVLGYSSISKQYAIKSLDEARAYLAHPVLGKRILDCCRALLAIRDRTLFAQVSEAGSAFHLVLDRYFEGVPDARTLELLATPSP